MHRPHVCRFIARLRSAFTLIELLVSTAIVGIVAALAIVGVGSARNAALDAMCRNNLQDIGTAVQVFHDTMGYFPPGGVEHRSVAAPNGKQLAWSALLLPFIEQTTLYRSLDLSKGFDAPENAMAAATIVPTYLCPLSGRPSSLLQGRAVCDYGGVRGENITAPNPRKSGTLPVGVMIYDNDMYPAPPRPLRIRRADIRDGMPQTIMIAEDTQTRDGQWINDANVFDQGYAINRAQVQYANVGERENDMFSNHRGGVHAVFCDGHVQFLNQEIDLKILAGLCTRDGREMVNDEDY